MSNLKGKIKSIAVRNFLTYDELKFHPGENLNIIIGPNGTGKSSVVAAIILGCGGKPTILSRSKDISDYVKNGKTKADIEIELYSNEQGETSVFTRSFDKHSKENFRIDGNKVTGKAYSEMIKQEYNIHVDNLCMFLPQDRVQDFTKLNPQEILQSTQSSVCSQEINETFESLKQTRDAQKNLSKNYKDIQVQLEDHQNRNDQLHTMIENNKLKNKLTKECELYKKKLAWLEFDSIKAKYDEAASDVQKLKESISNKKDLLKPLEKRQTEISGTKKMLQDSITKTDILMKQFNGEIDKLMDVSYKLESDIGQARQNFRNTIANAKIHEKDIQEHEFMVNIETKDLETAKQKLQSEGDFEGSMKEFENLMKNNKSKIESILQKKEDLQRHLEETILPEINNCKRKIEYMNDTERQKFNSLRANFEDAYQACKWLEANRQNFRGHIFNPIITEITVTEKKYAKYVENVIANRDFETFLCTNKEDMRDLIFKFRNELKLHVNVGYTDPDEELRFRSDICIDNKLKNLGVYAYILDVIDGPVPVLNYLCGLYRIHNTAIGNDKTYQCASQLPDSINVFFSTNHRFTVQVSAYSGVKSTSSSQIFARNIVNVGIDQAAMDHELNRLHQLERNAEKMRTERVPLQKEIEKIETEQVEIRNQKNALSAKLRNIKALETNLRKRQAELENLKNHKVNIIEERRKSKNSVDSIVNRLLENNSKVYRNLENYKDSYIQNALAKKKLQLFDDSTGNVDDQIQRLRYDLSRVVETLRRAGGLCERTEKEMNEAKEEALKLTNNQSPQDKKFKYKEAFKKIPDESHAVQDKIFEMQGRIDCIRGVDPRVMTEYEERKQMIEELQHQLTNEQERTVQLEQKLQRLHAKWYPEIQRIVETINQNFSAFFAKMGFVGEVELSRKEERDYNDYGIQIRVQYRDNEKLQALNRHVQSGGERAVAIAVFTLSLQHLTTVPFRCVDEINQGMDPKNERKIFQMLVDITCRPGESQYFFVTPKLLPNLPYSDLMTVHVVHNGKHINDSYVFMPTESDDE